jgi:predicted enzyme related to lactoylglutathione lyase
VADPFETAFQSLREPVRPVDPDPNFAQQLRARRERALRLPRGVAVTTTTIRPAAVSPAVAPGGAIPYLAVRGAREALSWYVEQLGAQVKGEPIVMPDGRIGHAELALGGGAIYLADEHPEIGVVAPSPEAAAVSLVLQVPDVDETFAGVRAAGARVVREPSEGYGHRGATIVDPFGHRWMLQTPLVAAGAQSYSYAPGDAGYASLWVPDVDRAAEFYAAVLGWTYEADHSGRGRRVIGATPAQGLFGGQPRGTLFAAYVVEDVHDAIERVRAAGGTAEEPTREPWGLSAMCTDNQGGRLTIYEPADADAGGAEPPLNGLRAGDLTYLTMQVPDSAKAREFYGLVLGWEFEPGRIDDGWQVTNTHPMTGLSGGHAEFTVVAMWRVDDIDAAVQRVRAAGGRASDPERQPYGISADCEDDQGTKFWLGQI